ncbi:DUF2442 domain-containing protein [Synechocystis salina]|uniref:DUF2442 domain-containing protein n=1 Tax=Synechocystis salina TaxID=945780 RepID=UPI001D13ECB3|nr:DUF2442 domain-containing protein [Synechocystis salina]
MPKNSTVKTTSFIYALKTIKKALLTLNNKIEFTGVFEPLQNPDYFVQVKVNHELERIQWPNGAELDPDVLCEAIS